MLNCNLAYGKADKFPGQKIIYIKMTPRNILDINCRQAFRKWLAENHAKESECWVAVKRGNNPPADMLWYLDAVEEALCFGWIDSTVKTIDSVTLQRFGKRVKNSQWTELNKERCRRLEALGLMTDSGRAVYPDLAAVFEIMPEVLEAFKSDPDAWKNFNSFHPLYQRVRIDNIQRVRKSPDLFSVRLRKLIEASRNGKMIGSWDDNGRLTGYGN